MKEFNQIVENDFEKLDIFTKAITRVHGKSHPEVFEVRELFETINEKVNKAENNHLNLANEFTHLRKVTNHYEIPEGACEAFAGTYNMLEKADKAYHI